ncbi:DUF5067 domain-containing protein [Fructilactobacillus cliffordii]|uniref:DUF5067 domain-containing protein n=1 Tax=Fructilactobacillus cliffordii TaxID=2940299 RepID=UPI002092B3A0|nr:DUF5067 domain-containing protein [Fructilactobacillus cliffordii]USS86518.1 DUF5067 domain-containing protein [Fructilactobacillus cliffordii]
MKKQIILGLAAVATLSLAGCSSSKQSQSKPKSATTSKTSQQPSFRNNVAQLNDKTIRIKGVKTIKQPNESSPSMVAFIYQVTNKSNHSMTPMDAWNANMKVMQNKQKLDQTKFSDDSLPSNPNESIAKGQTVKSSVVYKLNNTKDPISINASQGINQNAIDPNSNQQIDGTDVGTQTFAISQ